MASTVSRKYFIKIGILSLGGSFIGEFTTSAASLLNNDIVEVDRQLMEKLTLNNDIQVTSIISGDQITPDNHRSSFRGLAVAVSCLSASLCNTDSEYYHSEELIKWLEEAMDIMSNAQYPDGTLDSGGNRQSPPDTAFVLEHICTAAAVMKMDEYLEFQLVKVKLGKFIRNAAEAMVTGGVHTPNHRWVVCAALARIYSLFPDEKYIRRIDEWMAEGIYINEDGHYPERSGNYAAVVNWSLITVSRFLNRPELLSPVVKNLTTTYYYTEPNGDLISIDSRRQDQWYTQSVTKFYLQYRYLAIKNNDKMFSYIAKYIENLPDFRDQILSRALLDFMENTDLKNELPKSKTISKDFEKFFEEANLARIRHGNTSMTIFGGNDKPIIVSSGRSSNPNFLSYRKGRAILKYMRLSTSFFRMGYFSSDGLAKGDQKYILKEIKEAYYYQPMPEGSRKADGDYKLSQSVDGRFWNKMDFDSRQKSNVQKLITVVEITENKGILDLNFKVGGPPNVAVTIEMCFNEDGLLTGTEIDSDNNYFLNEGFGEYSIGSETIKFGPGKVEHKRVSRLESEQYAYHQGSLRTDGLHVYLTGYTPFNHKMTIG